MKDTYYLDVSHHALHKYGEELCGDHIEVSKLDDRLIVVLADGLGSGVKANILATLTSKIMSTMLSKGADLMDTIDTITKTLPVCQVRKIGYSTFTILDIDSKNHARIIEFDNPPIFYLHHGNLCPLKKTKMISSNKEVWVSEIDLVEDDALIMVSDGVIHAGVGKLLNHGWEWQHVADFLQQQNVKTAEKLTRRLLETCQNLYEDMPGDDTSAVTVKLRKAEWTQVLTGPPERDDRDPEIVKAFIEEKGLKVVCGGTAANIIARELNTEVRTNLEYLDPFVPPTAEIDGLNLVTEGVLTLKMALNTLKNINKTCSEPIFHKKDGVSKLLKLLLEETTHIQFWLGSAINPAHQNPDFPKDLSIKTHIVEDLIKELKKAGKEVLLKCTD
ncbi:SpoIIE family protein phosphatase [Fusibacter tunisiensis]|uniref:Serine/threonine protein phosphatase PrpC n=1 Tax=Fusibacter tunisiensis TaxID=1008308 RepID=A0ABS2MT90_9FIRM|nr:SpoIIE family protein phosphatase [Fusibacter tunisiensis]MBM7562570.1 serine/threonine protein phosphatase PrpC [Fusibacter tunisiensis]